MINKIIDLLNELHDLSVKNNLVVGVDVFGEKVFDKKSVQVMETDTFFNYFQQWDIKNRDSNEYPYEVVCEIDGVRFFTLLKQDEYEKYVLKKEETA